MGYKHITEEVLKQMRVKEKNKLSDSHEVTDVAGWNRYRHCYFEDLTVTHNEYTDPMLVFTVKVNYLPAKPVYIDIGNLLELISSLSTKYRTSEAKELKDEIVDLLIFYRQKT